MRILDGLHTLAQLPHSKCLFDLLSGWGGGKVPLWTGHKANADRLLCSHQPVAVLAILKFLYIFFKYSLTKKAPNQVLSDDDKHNSCYKTQL